MITFANTGISTTPTKSGRTLVYTDIILNGETYKWAMYVPKLENTDLESYLQSNAWFYEAEILKKENLWSSMPKTEEIIGPGGTIITVDIPKERIVHPTIPDDYEKAIESGEEHDALKRLIREIAYGLLDSSLIPTQEIISNLTIISEPYTPGKEYKQGEKFNYEGKLYIVEDPNTLQLHQLPGTELSQFKEINIEILDKKNTI